MVELTNYKKFKKIFVAFLAFTLVFTSLNVASCAHKDVRVVKTGDVIYFDTKNLNWDTVKIYFYSTWGKSEIVKWDDSVQMTKVSDVSIVFSYTIPVSPNAGSHNCNMLVFQNGNGGDSNQTIDLGFIETVYAYIIENYNTSDKKKGYWYVYGKTELAELYNSVKDYEELYYTQDTWNAFKERLDAAKNSLDNEVRVGKNVGGSYECDYETVISDLKTARNNLVVNKEILKNKIGEVNALDFDGYTKDTVDAIKVAEEKYNSSDITVSDVKAQVKNLDDAINRLVEKTTIDTNENNVTSDKPNTGTYVVIVIIVIVIAAVVLIATTVYNNKKKSNKTDKK